LESLENWVTLIERFTGLLFPEAAFPISIATTLIDGAEDDANEPAFAGADF
jgi:hypothetical protein